MRQSRGLVGSEAARPQCRRRRPRHVDHPTARQHHHHHHHGQQQQPPPRQQMRQQPDVRPSVAVRAHAPVRAGGARAAPAAREAVGLGAQRAPVGQAPRVRDAARLLGRRAARRVGRGARGRRRRAALRERRVGRGRRAAPADGGAQRAALDRRRRGARLAPAPAVVRALAAERVHLAAAEGQDRRRLARAAVD